jgi:hypothetical protein
VNNSLNDNLWFFVLVNAEASTIMADASTESIAIAAMRGFMFLLSFS